MSDNTCGHETADGTPCQNPITDGDSCWIPAHGGNADEHGRPSKLTYERQEGIANMIEEGRSMVSAARTHGVDPATVYNWLDRGESEHKAGNKNEFADFYHRIVRAKGYGEEWYFNMVVEIARDEGDHRFLASLMKQRYPDSWGDTDTGVDARKLEVHLPENAIPHERNKH